VATEWNLTTGEQLRSFSGHGDFVWGISVLDGYLFTASSECTAIQWSLDSGEKIREFQPDDGDLGAESHVWSIHAYKGNLYTGDSRGVATKWAITSGAALKTYNGHDGWVTTVQCVESRVRGPELYTGSADGTVRQWNLDTARCARVFQLGSAWIMSLTCQGSTLAAGTGEGEIILCNSTNGNETHRKTLHKDAIVCISIQGDDIYSASQDGNVHRYNKSTSKTTGSLKVNGKATAVCQWKKSIVATSDSLKASNIVILGADHSRWGGQSRTSYPTAIRPPEHLLAKPAVSKGKSLNMEKELKMKDKPWNKIELATPPKKEKAPPRAIEAITRLDRPGELAKVFRAFDIDRSGSVETAELMKLGQARRELGQKRGAWTAEKNAKMIANMDQGKKDGLVDKEEFVAYFLKSLGSSDDKAFTATIEQFKAVAATVAKKKVTPKAIDKTKEAAMLRRVDMPTRPPPQVKPMKLPPTRSSPKSPTSPRSISPRRAREMKMNIEQPSKGDLWVQRSTYTMSWDWSGPIDFVNVSLELQDGSRQSHVIGEEVPNSGSLVYHVRSAVSPGLYVIRIKGLPGGVEALSPTFHIEASPDGASPSPSISPPKKVAPPSRAALVLRQGPLNREAELGRVFQVFDLDGSGYIEAKELMVMGQARQKLGQKSRVWTEEKNARMMKQMDTGDKDGKVDQGEFVGYFSNQFQKMEDQEFRDNMENFKVCAPKKRPDPTARLHRLDSKKIRAIFAALDTDQSETVMRDELVLIDDTGKLMQDLDGDDDGFVRLEEFVFFFVDMLHSKGETEMRIFIDSIGAKVGVTADLKSPRSPRKSPRVHLEAPAPAKAPAEEEDEECAWAPGSPTGRQGSDLMSAKQNRQVNKTLLGKPSYQPLSNTAEPLEIAEVFRSFPVVSPGNVEKEMLVAEIYALAKIDIETTATFPDAIHERIQDSIENLMGDTVSEKSFVRALQLSLPRDNSEAATYLQRLCAQAKMIPVESSTFTTPPLPISPKTMKEQILELAEPPNPRTYEQNPVPRIAIHQALTEQEIKPAQAALPLPPPLPPPPAAAPTESSQLAVKSGTSDGLTPLQLKRQELAAAEAKQAEAERRLQDSSRQIHSARQTLDSHRQMES